MPQNGDLAPIRCNAKSPDWYHTALVQSDIDLTGPDGIQLA